jgi:hypothetical protein
MGAIVENIFPFISPGGVQGGKVNPTTVASTTAMPAPTALITFVSGTTSITSIALPYPNFTGYFVYIPTGAMAAATGGPAATTSALPIAAAFTATTNVPVMVFTDGNLWYLK